VVDAQPEITDDPALTAFDSVGNAPLEIWAALVAGVDEMPFTRTSTVALAAAVVMPVDAFMSHSSIKQSNGTRKAM